jgi:asparagine synthetase B (glutamine-hydrolysing)
VDRIVGMTASRGLDAVSLARLRAAEDRAFAEVPWLQRSELRVGDTDVRVWGQGPTDGAVRRLPGGDVAIVVGRPLPDPSDEQLAGVSGRVPWEGRLLVVRISADGSRWDAFNDWAGSIPAFHAPAGEGRILSTLEPAVVSGAGLTAHDISQADLVCLLVHGFFLGDRTLYRTMRALATDTAASWGPDGFSAVKQGGVAPSPDHWHDAWDDLADGFHERVHAAVARCLRTEPAWNVPLSGGLDSRLIAAVGAAEGIPMETFTYGTKGWLDVRVAKQVAKQLGLPWRHVPLGTDYLAARTPTWAALFGTSLHFHGMYQFPLLESVGGGPPPIAMGFTGDPMGGAQTEQMMQGDRPPRRRFVDKWHMWSEEEVGRLLRRDVSADLAELDAEMEAQLDAVDGELYQRIWMLFQNNHMARFASYQPTLHDWWSGVGAPFVDRALANFAVSMPRGALDSRRLQAHSLRRAHPALATIPGTWSFEPALGSGRWYLRRTLADILPRRLHRGPLGEFAPPANTVDQEALAATGDAALWPLPASREVLADVVDLEMVDAAERTARAGDLGSMARLEAVQALAWALR